MQKKEYIAVGFLSVLVFMCFCMVTLGGWVRLSGSGLSIPEWPFFTIERVELPSGEIEERKSAFPPTTEEGWATLHHTLVTELPQYEGIAMSEFKRMFMIEWSHRGLAKSIGVVYLAFLIFTLATPMLRRNIGLHAGAGIVLLVSQAVVGGLVVLFHLDSVKVSLHLILAFYFTGLLVWMLFRLTRPADEKATASNPISKLAIILFLIISAQIFSGGLMAATHAGYILNTWPKMGDQWVPPGMYISGDGLFTNFTENKVMVQFFHRWFAIATAMAVLFFVLRCMTVQVSRPARWAVRAIFAVVALQVTLGILTLLGGVQVHLALTHQSLGLILLLNCLIIVYETVKHPVLTEEILAERAERESKADTSTATKAAVNV